MAQSQLGGESGMDQGAQFPDTLDAVIEDGFALLCAFNPTGTLFLTGCSNGSIRVC
jgi:hypothetical protein